MVFNYTPQSLGGVTGWWCLCPSLASQWTPALQTLVLRTGLAKDVPFSLLTKNPSFENSLKAINVSVSSDGPFGINLSRWNRRPEEECRAQFVVVPASHAGQFRAGRVRCRVWKHFSWDCFSLIPLCRCSEVARTYPPPPLWPSVSLTQL